MKYPWLILSLFCSNLWAVELQGQLTQGGIVIGQVEANSEVRLNDRPLKVTKTGQFVIGFNREAALEQQLSIISPTKGRYEHNIKLSQRQYKVDHIEGVEQKYVAPPASVLARIKRDNQLIGQARSVNSDRVDFLQPFIMPAIGRISGVYGSQRIFNGTPKNPHYGLDIANKEGSNVIAPQAGKVLLAEKDLYYSGGTLIIDHGYGISSTFIHLSDIYVEVDQEVKQGDRIAAIGSTGRVTGPHLDWRINWFSVRIDPQLLLFKPK